MNGHKAQGKPGGASGHTPANPVPANVRDRAAPYHFVPVEPDSAVLGEPGLHDTLDLDQHWSGELHCTLTALTPLLAANDQYSWEQARPELKAQYERMLHQRFGGAVPGGVADGKKFLEPLTDTAEGAAEPGPVLIGGAALKGLIRHSLGASCLPRWSTWPSMCRHTGPMSRR